MNRFQIILIILGLFLFSVNISAQDTHYWNLQYGTRSTLLGGAVIGSVTDMLRLIITRPHRHFFQNPRFSLVVKSINTAR